MPQRNELRTAILASLETQYGVDPVPTGATNAIQVSNPTIRKVNAQTADRALVRPFLGASQQLVGTIRKEVSFEVELVGSGTIGTAPAWGVLLRACGFAQTVVASSRVDYTPVSDAFDSCTIYYHDDGVRSVLRGARGTVQLRMVVDEVPRLLFRFEGLDTAEAAAANPAVTLTAFQVGQVVTDTNTGDTIFGGTHSTSGAPGITTGTAYPSRGLELDVGQAVSFVPMLGQEQIEINSRSATGSVTLDLTPAQEVTLLDAVRAGTLQSLGLVHGTVSGRRSMVWMPQVQLLNPTVEALNNKRLQRFDLLIPTITGNDEIRIVTSF